MKRALGIIAAIIAITSLSMAQDVTITNFIPGYIYVPNTTADAGDTGLATNTGYACIPASALTFATTNALASNSNGDFRVFVFACTKDWVDAYEALGTNNPARLTITEDSGGGGSVSDLLVVHKFVTAIDLGTVTIPAE